MNLEFHMGKKKRTVEKSHTQLATLAINVWFVVDIFYSKWKFE